VWGCSALKIHDGLLIVLLSFSLITSPVQAKEPAPCSATLLTMVEKTMESITAHESDADRGKSLYRSLKQRQARIINRVLQICPETAPCPPGTLVRAVVTMTEEELADIEAPNVKVGWRVWFSLGSSAIAYVGLSTGAQNYMTNISATLAVAFLTLLAPYVLEAMGAPVLDFVLSPFRRWIYSTNHLAFDRDLDRHQSMRRHQLIYMLQQELVSDIERLGRSTDTEVILRLMGVLNNCTAQSCSSTDGRDRASEVIAKLLSHVVKQFPEIDLRDSDYAEWVQALFGKWQVSKDVQYEFVRQVMDKLVNQYDLAARHNPQRQRKYLGILRAWFSIDGEMTHLEFSDGSGI
jgi:hypothetical protein